jgi:hypothetical protein
MLGNFVTDWAIHHIAVANRLHHVRHGFRLYLKNWRYFGVKLFGTGWDMMGLHEQNRFLVIGTKVLFYT